MVWGIVAAAVAGGVVLLVLLWLVSVPLFGCAPVPFKTCFARLMRTTTKPKEWSFTRIEGTSLYVGTVPRTAAHLAELHSLGVRAVVTLNQAWEPQIDGGVPKAAAAAGMHHLNAPTPDFAAPTQRHLRAAVDFMQEHVNAGHGLYVHCNGGRGRSVVCLLGFLIRSKGLTAHEAYALVAQHHRVASQRKIAKLVARPLGIPRPQWRALLLFEEAERVATALAAASAKQGAEVGEERAAGPGAPPAPRTKRSAKVAPA